VVRRLRIPYTVALVLVGLAITWNQSLSLNLTPDLILALLVPPLVFEAAFHLSAAELRRVLPTILLLAVPGVIVTMLVVGGLDAYLIETTLTTVLAYGSYLLAERLQVSGVLAVVAAGLVAGNLGPRTMSPTTRVVLVNFWDYAAFLANSLVFLLIGLQVHLPSLLAAWQ